MIVIFNVVCCQKMDNDVMIVKNINGTGNDTYNTPKCKCSSWIKHWRKNTHSKRNVCCVKGCTNENVEGAHVQIVGSYDRSWYIAPFCKKCNKIEGEIELVKNVNIYPVDKNKCNNK